MAVSGARPETSSSAVKGRLHIALASTLRYRAGEELQTLSRQHVDAQSDHTNTAQSTRSPAAPRPAIRAAALRSSFDRICPTCGFPPAPAALFSRSCFARKRSCRFARDQYAPPRSSWPTCSSAGASAGRFSGRVGFFGAESAGGASDSLETSGVQVERRTCSSRASRAPAGGGPTVS